MDISEDSKVSPRKEETLKVEPGELLEEGWFFGNLLDRKTRIMSRCFSDPSPSSKVTQGMLVERSFEETYSSINKKVSFPVVGPAGGGGEVLTNTPQPHLSRPSLMRTPSIPSPNRSNSGRVLVQTSNTTTATTNNRLKRTPSLPAMDMDINNNIEDEEESDYSMGRLIRQASLGQSNTLPPRQHTPKKLIPSTIPKQHYPRRKPEQEGSIERRRRQILRKDKIKNSPLNVETKQAKDLKGSDMDSLIKEMKMLPKLQEEKIMEEDEEEEENYKETIKVRKPYVPEARRLERTTSASPELRRLERTTSASPVLDNIVRPRTTDDMKAQIKFWARAVASNVR